VHDRLEEWMRAVSPSGHESPGRPGGLPAVDRTMAGAMHERRIAECHDCGLRQALGAVPPGTVAECRRCGCVLLSVPADSLDRSLALTATGLVLIVIANTMPFMSLSIQGRFQQASLITGVIEFVDQGLWPLAAVVLFAKRSASSTISVPVQDAHQLVLSVD